jgi:hypothetical protein
VKALPEIRDWFAFIFAVGLPLFKWLQRRQRPQGVRHVLELHDAVTVTDSVEARPVFLQLSSANGTSSASLELSAGPTRLP